MALRPTKYRYVMDQARRELWQDVYVIRRMVNDPLNIGVLFEDPYNWLQDIVGRLYQKDWVQLKGDHFAAASSGRGKLEVFFGRFHEYLKMFDGFSSVNYQSGEFAIARYLDMDDATYQTYINANDVYGWKDFRVAVAERKGLDPLEIVFMSLLAADEFDNHPNGWQFAVASGEMWDRVARLCNNTIHLDQMGDPESGLSPEDDCDNLIQAGSELFIQLMQRQAQQNALRAAQAQAAAKTEQVETEPPDEETKTRTYRTVRYVRSIEPVYQPPTYYVAYTTDPLYLSPVWQERYW